MRLKKKAKRNLIILLILIILAGAGLTYYFVFYKSSNVNEVKVENKIKGYGYELKDTKSKAYKKLFYQLEEVLKEKPVDEKKYVKTISKMFLLDFYSLDDKVAKTDIGGFDFVHSTIVSNFMDKAEDTVYKYLESNIYGQRNQKLPTVSEVTIESVEQDVFTYGDITDEEAYTVKAKIEYKEDMEYPTEATLVFVHEDKKLSLVEIS